MTTISDDDMSLALLRLVRAAQPISRADIARRFGVYRSTVTDIVVANGGSSALRGINTFTASATVGVDQFESDLHEHGRGDSDSAGR